MISVASLIPRTAITNYVGHATKLEYSSLNTGNPITSPYGPHSKGVCPMYSAGKSGEGIAFKTITGVPAVYTPRLPGCEEIVDFIHLEEKGIPLSHVLLISDNHVAGLVRTTDDMMVDYPFKVLFSATILSDNTISVKVPDPFRAALAEVEPEIIVS